MTGAKLIKKAKTYLGNNWSKFCKKYGYSYAVPWCCIWVWYIFMVNEASKLFYAGKKVCNCRTAFLWCLANLPKVKMADARAGDIVFFTWSNKGNNSFNYKRTIDHIGFIEKKGTSSIAYTIEGNTLNLKPSLSKVAERKREKSKVLGIFRPKYSSEIVSKGLTDVVAYAKKRAKEHHKYKVGGRSWKTGIDCHGFTGACFGHCGYSKIKEKVWKKGSHKKFNTKAYLGDYLIQHNKKGLNKKKLLPGDIVYRKNKSMSGHHSAICIGDGKVAEAVKSGTRVAKITKKFTYAFRIPESAKDKKLTTPEPAKKKTTVKTVDHKATYTVIAKDGSNVRARATKYSSRVGGLKKGATFKTTKKHGQWVYGASDKVKGWVCLGSKTTSYLKKK